MLNNKEGIMKTGIRLYLVKAREAKGLSMHKAARLAGMSYQHYSNFENGYRGSRVSFMIMARIADALDLSLDFIKAREEEYQHANDNEDY